MSRSSESLIQFTDEELLLFGAEHPIVDAPYLSRLDATHRKVALEVALRSLCAHGAVVVNDGAGMELPQSVVTMLQVRSCAKSTLVINKSDAESSVLRYHHFDTDHVLVEDVTDVGAHQFHFIDHADVATEIEAFCMVDGAADGEGEPVKLAADRFDSGELSPELWGDGVAQMNATVWRADGGGPALLVLGFLLGSAGSWSSSRVVNPLESDDRLVEVRPVKVKEIGRHIFDALLGSEVEGPVPDEWHLMRA